MHSLYFLVRKTEVLASYLARRFYVFLELRPKAKGLNPSSQHK